MKPAARAVLGLAAVAVLLLVFAAYGNPDFLMALSSQIWGCF